MAKRIQVSIDGGTIWRSLPGSSGEFREELNSVNDTVYGQSWQSEDVSIGQWTVSGNGYFKGVAGYIANLKQQGTPVIMTSEATTMVTTTKYRITAPTKRIIDYFSTLTVFDNAVDVSATNVASIDYLNGEINFTVAATGPVTVTGKYVPTTAIAKAKSFTLTQTAAEIDTTDYETARTNGGWRTFLPGLRTAGLDISGIYDYTNGAAAALRARSPVIVEVSPDNSADTLFRGYFKRQNRGQSGDVGALEEETHRFGLWVPDGALVARPFGWYVATGSALNLAVQDVLAAYQSESIIKVRYQNDPNVASSGHVGDAIVTECTLANTLEGLNEFRFTFRGSGTPASV